MTLETLTGLVNSLIHEPQAGLLNGILFGVKATLSEELKNALITTGALHIIALSGMNISILVGFVNLFLLRFVRRPIANVATIFIIIGFIGFVGVSPSVIRAAIMAGITLLSINLGRQVWPLFSWILAVSIMLLLNPLWIGDLSFQLSVLATLGIILFSQKDKTAQVSMRFSADSSSKFGFLHMRLLEKARLPAVFRPIVELIQDDLRVTLAAQVFTIPIIIFQFQRISLVSPLTNILIGWLIGPITIIGFILIAVGLVWMPLGFIVAWFAWVPLTFVIEIIRLTAKIPFASINF